MNTVSQISPVDARTELVRQARIWVGQTFFGTLLKQMRNSPFKSELLDGGRGGQAFSSLLDQRLAERISRGAARPLVESIVKHIERKRGVGASPTHGQDVHAIQQQLRSNLKQHVAPDPRA